MLGDLFFWIGPALMLVALALVERWYRIGPSARVQSKIATTLEAKGLQLLSVKPALQFRFRRNSRAVLIARATNKSGNVETVYFEVDIWADIFSRWTYVHELGGYPGSRFMSGGRDRSPLNSGRSLV
jgi:hypothetical protein